MSKTTRMISLILSIAIVLSLFPTAVLAAQETEAGNRVSVGDCILMGTKNNERISWKVLSVEENIALLHCNYVIDFLSYGPTSSYSYADAFAPWCTDFYSSGVFSEEEQNAIISTTVNGCDDQKLFLFSKSEFLTHFPNGEGGYRPLFTGVSGVDGAVGLGTVPATDDNLCYYLASTSRGSSWLDLASYVNKNYVDATSANLQNYQATYGVCPAMYVDIDQIDDSQIRQDTGTFRYESCYGEAKYPYTYDDSWFLEPSTDYNHELAKMSLRTAIAAYGTGSNSDGSEYIKELMDKKLGFSNLEIDYPKPQRNTIGYAIGSKKIPSKDDKSKAQTLILVAVRGGGYKTEWAGNFVVGTNSFSDGIAGDLHEGFSRAAKQVEDGLASYIKRNQQEGLLEDNCIVWIVGYSRGAAAANLLAKRLDDGNIDGIGRDNVFAYCFECPQNSRASDLTSSKYDNIMNIVNPLDFVPMVVMSAWNYGRYGRTFYIPYEEGVENYNNLKAQMVKQYVSILEGASESSNVYAATKQITGQRDMTEGAMNWLADTFYTPEIYTTLYQNDLVEIVEAFVANDWKWVSNTASAIKLLKMLGLRLELKTVDTVSFPATPMELADKIYGLNNDINASMFLGLILTGAIESQDIKKTPPTYAHYAELCLAWMDSLTGDQIVSIDRKYRRVFINCPVNVSIYNSENTLVGQINDRNVQDIENGVSVYIDSNDQIVISLPVTEEYRIEMNAVDAGTVTYTVTDHNIETSMADRVVSYALIEVKDGDVLIGQIENLDEVENAKYSLIHNKEQLTPTTEQTGNEVEKYAVNVIAENNGTVSGGGKAVYGEYRKVIATPDEGADFIGWFVDEKKISDELEYRFCVTSDITLTAKFTAAEEIPVVPGNPITTTPTVPTPETPFVDVPDDSYYQDAVIWASEEGITTGTSAVSFSPDASCTRAQAVTFLWRAVGSPAPRSTEMPFADVPSGAYYYDAVLWAVENGITTGTGDTTFSPNATCTRGQIVTFLWRTRNAPAVTAANPFADVAEDAYYRQAVLWAVKESVTTGTSATTFSPDADCTRAQIVTFLYRTFA